MEPYRILVTVDLLREPRQSRKTRDLILSFIDFLAKNPSAEGDYQEVDAVGRTVQIKVIADCALTFWTVMQSRRSKW